jgi:hypothetical protein
MAQRAVNRLMIAGPLQVGSVVKKYSSRCVLWASWTKIQRTGTSPCPPLYQWPVALIHRTRRVPPPYHVTVARLRVPRAATWTGAGSLRPLTRGRPGRSVAEIGRSPVFVSRIPYASAASRTAKVELRRGKGGRPPADACRKIAVTGKNCLPHLPLVQFWRVFC